MVRVSRDALDAAANPALKGGEDVNSQIKEYIMRESPNVFAVILIPIILGGVLIMLGDVLSLPIVQKSTKAEGSCVRVLSIDRKANCNNLPEKYVTEWME